MIDFDLSEVLAEPTTQRTETESNTDFDLDNLEFEEVETVEAVEEEPQVVIHQISEQEAREGAKILVDLIDTGNKVALTPLARWKLQKKKIGSREVLKKLQLLFAKQTAGDELTDQEKRQVWVYTAYLKDLETVEKAIPFTKDEREMLIASATKYFKDKNIKFGGQNSFWLELLMIESMKITQILTA